MRCERICRRKPDGALFRPSHPGDWTEADVLCALLFSEKQFYFRSVRWVRPRWWQLRGHWEDTGEIWQPESGEFDVLDELDALTQFERLPEENPYLWKWETAKLSVTEWVAKHLKIHIDV